MIEDIEKELSLLQPDKTLSIFYIQGLNYGKQEYANIYIHSGCHARGYLGRDQLATRRKYDDAVSFLTNRGWSVHIVESLEENNEESKHITDWKCVEL